MSNNQRSVIHISVDTILAHVRGLSSMRRLRCFMSCTCVTHYKSQLALADPQNNSNLVEMLLCHLLELSHSHSAFYKTESNLSNQWKTGHLVHHY